MTYNGELYTSDYFVRHLQKNYPDAQVDIIAYNDDGDGYNWEKQVVYRVHSDSMDVYYLGHDSGCSCTAYGRDSELLHFSSRRSLLYYLRNTAGFYEVYQTVRSIKTRGVSPKR